MSKSTRSPIVTVIIPTTAEPKREKTLIRAIDSIKSQESVIATILVIVNGDRCEQVFFEKLKKNPALSVHYLETGSAPKAVAFGRSLVVSPYFSILDDDDEYLPHALKCRLSYFNDSIDVVVSSGYRDLEGERMDLLSLEKRETARIHPIKSLFYKKNNWLTSAGGLFRTQTVGIEYFEKHTAYYEWSYLAVRLSLERTVSITDEQDHVIHYSQDSLSKSEDFMHGEIDYFNEVKKLELPESVKKIINQNSSAAFHVLAEHYLKKSDMKNAWRAHLSSMRNMNSFLRYALFSRKFLIPDRH